MPIKVKLDLDDRKARSDLEKFQKSAGRPIRTSAQSSGAGATVHRSYENTQRARSRNEKQRQGLYSAYNEGSGIASQATSGQDQFSRGGFYEAMKDKADALKRVRDMFKKSYGPGLDKLGQGGGSDEMMGGTQAQSGSDGSAGRGGIIAQLLRKNLQKQDGNTRQQRVQRMTVQNAVVQTMRTRSGGGGGGMMGGGGGGSGVGAMSAGTMGGMGKAAPFIGIIFAAIAGVLKGISAAGERYTQVQMAQLPASRAIGFTNYQGGLYDHAEVAMGQLEYAKTTGIKGKRFNGAGLSFAASQGMGASEYGQLIGDIQYGAPGVGIGQLSGYAMAGNVRYHKQGEYLREIAKHTKGMRDQGYGKMDNTQMKSFLGIAAQMSRTQEATGSTSGRGLEIASKIDSTVRQADKGGPLGMIALSQMMSGGMDYFSAVKKMEKDGLGGAAGGLQNFFKGMDPNIKAYLMRDWGVSTMSEGENVNFGSVGPARANFAANPNKAVELKNKTDMLYGTPGSFGETAAGIGYRTQEALLNVMQAQSGNLNKLAMGIATAQEGIIKMASGAVTGIEELIKKADEIIKKIERFL